MTIYSSNTKHEVSKTIVQLGRISIVTCKLKLQSYLDIWGISIFDPVRGPGYKEEVCKGKEVTVVNLSITSTYKQKESLQSQMSKPDTHRVQQLTVSRNKRIGKMTMHQTIS